MATTDSKRVIRARVVCSRVSKSRKYAGGSTYHKDRFLYESSFELEKPQPQDDSGMEYASFNLRSDSDAFEVGQSYDVYLKPVAKGNQHGDD